MARERMVTRTVEQATCEILVCDLVTQQTSVETYVVSATVPQEKVCKHLAKINANCDNAKNTAFVHCLSYTVSEILYGMPESTFIELAKILPPRSTTNE